RLSDSQAKDLPPTADPQELARAIDAIQPADQARKTETTARALQKLQAPRVAIPASKLRRAFLPFPASQGLEIYGFQPARLVLRRTYRTFEKDAASKHPCEENVFAHLPSVQGYLKEQINAAHQFLSESPALPLWNHCTPELARLIRARNAIGIKQVRDRFFID